MQPRKEVMVPLPFLLSITTLTAIATVTATSSDTFVYGGCSRIKYTPNSVYETNVNSLLTSLVNSAMYTTPFNKFTIGTSSSDIVYGLYQCRSDLPKGDCSTFIQHALSQLGVLCVDSSGGALQLEGCFIKYDNTTFLGVEDKTVVVRKCGPPLEGYDSDGLTRRDELLGYLLTSGDGLLFRTGESGNMQGVVQCVGDLSGAQCQDCLIEAIERLKSDCGLASWGDMFLAKCYVRYTNVGGRSHEDAKAGSSQDDEIEKTLSILVGLIAGVALIIIFLAFLGKLCEGKGGK